MAEKRVSVRLGATGGDRVKAEFRGIGEAGARGMARIRREMESVNARLATLGRRLRLAFRLAGAAVAGAVGAMTRSSLTLIDAQAKLAQSLGTTTASVQVLQRAGDLAGVSLGEIQQAGIQLTKRLSQAAAGTGPAVKALDRLGLSAEVLAKVPLDERIATIQDAIERLVPETERAGVAAQLFGDRAGLIFSRIDSATLRIATEDVRRFGIAVSEQDADQIERTNDALSRLGLIGRGLSNQLAVALAPALEAVADGIAHISEVGGPVQQAFQVIGRALTGLIANFDRVVSLAGGFAVFLAGRFVGGFLLAATGVRGLATALVVLRGALIRTGIGALIVGLGELIFQFGRLMTGAGGLGEALRLLGDVGREFGRRLATEFDRIDAAASASALSIKAGVADWVADAIGNVVGFGNASVNTFQGAFDAIKAIWVRLPEAIGDLVIQAANATIRGVDSLLGSAAGAIDGFIGRINRALEAAGLERRLGTIGEISLGDIPNPFAGAASEAAQAAAEAFREAFEASPFEGPVELIEALRAAAADASLRGLEERQRATELAAGIANRPGLGASDAVRALRAALRRADAETGGATDDAAAALKRVTDAFEQAGQTADEAGRKGGGAGRQTADAADKATEALKRTFDTAATGLARSTETLRRFAAQAGDLSGQIGDVLVGAFRSAEGAFRTFVEGGKVDFRGLVASILADLATLSFRSGVLAPIANALAGVFGGGGGGLFGGLFGSAKGNVFASGRLVPFAAGGVVDRPALFPLRGGRIGLMGEAGPEAILPLRRIGGRLGVEATGAGAARSSASVTVNIDARGAQQGVAEQIDARIRRALPAIQEAALRGLRESRRRGFAL